jgi:hypothetical protein
VPILIRVCALGAGSRANLSLLCACIVSVVYHPGKGSREDCCRRVVPDRDVRRRYRARVCSTEVPGRSTAAMDPMPTSSTALSYLNSSIAVIEPTRLRDHHEDPVAEDAPY